MSASDARVNETRAVTFDWPTDPLPEVKYPYYVHARQNEANEAEALDKIRKMILQSR